MSRIADIKLNRRSFVMGSLMLGAASPFVLSACSSGKQPADRLVAVAAAAPSTG